MEVPDTVFSYCDTESVMVRPEEMKVPDSVFSVCGTEAVRVQPGGMEVPSTVFSLCGTEAVRVQPGGREVPSAVVRVHRPSLRSVILQAGSRLLPGCRRHSPLCLRRTADL